VAVWLERFGITASTSEIEAVLMEVKQRSLDKKGLLNEDEFLRIVDSVLPGRRAA
jgi:hypothetical protein